MPKRKLIVEFEGKTFTRTTDRPYQFLIVGRLDLEKSVASVRRSATEITRQDWSYYKKVAAGEHSHTWNEAYVAKCKRLTALPMEDAKRVAADEAEAACRAEFKGGWHALSWAGRRDLADAQVRRFLDPLYCMAEVRAVPVPETPTAANV